MTNLIAVTSYPPRDNNHIIQPHDHINFLKSRSKSRKHTRFKIGSFNVQGGLKGTLKCSHVLEDMKRLNISVCALQESKAQDIIYLNHSYGRILGFPSDIPYYSLAFGIRNNLQIHSAEHISDRIAVISIFLNNNRATLDLAYLQSLTHMHLILKELRQILKSKLILSAVTRNKS